MADSRRGRLGRYLGIAIGSLLVVSLGVFVWYTGQRMQRLDRELHSAQQQAETVSRKLQEYSQELSLAIQGAQAAREKARSAQTTAEQSAEARKQAEAQAETARAEAAKNLEALQQIRQKRKEELDRMQEALSRVAETRRTENGMVIDLANDSFRFDFDKAALRAENREMLSRIAGILLASQGYRLFVYGHTDDIGTDEYNQGLSERRAQAVRDYLVKAGIPADIISAKGFGKTSPRVHAKTNAAREKNRRVEIGIIDTIINYGDEVRSL